MNEVLTKATIEMATDCQGAEMTNRVTGNNLVEWRENAKIDGIPVSVYYMTGKDEQDVVDDNGGDWGAIDWESCIDRIEIDICECDRQEISDSAIAALTEKLN